MIQAAIAKYLADVHEIGVFGAAGAILFVDELPATPVGAIAISTKTAPPGDYSENKIAGIQIVVRADPGWGLGRARPGYAVAITLRDILHGLRHVTLDPGGIDETRLIWMRSDGDEPVNLGDDPNGHPRWSIRFIAQYRVVTANTIL